MIGPFPVLRRGRPSPAQRDDQLVALASAVARSVTAGATLRVALQDAGSELGEPLRSEVAGVIGSVGAGASLDEALLDWNESAASDAVALFATAARIGHAEGGQLATAMDGVAVALSDRCELRAEARSQTAQARLSVRVLVALPVVGLGVFALVEPQVLPTLLGTPAGLACLVLGVLLDAAGASVASGIVGRVLR